VAEPVTADNGALSGRMQFAAGITAVLIAALIIATFAYVRGSGIVHEGPVPGAASSSRLPTPAVTPSPVSESARQAVNGWVVDADLAGASTGWVLLSNCIQPMTGQCGYFVARTGDGGGTWSKAVQVGPLFDPTDGDAPRHVHFINAQDGFVYGGVVAYSTHDAGLTWTSVNVNQTFISAMAGLGQQAWLITYPCAKGSSCPYEVRSSSNAGRTWSSPHSLPPSFSPSDAVAFGRAGLLISNQSVGDLQLTQDGGATWRVVKTQCTGNNFIAKVATSDGNELWELCIDYPDVSGSNISHTVVFVSEDGGQTWPRRGTSQVSGQQAASRYLLVLAASRPGTAVTATNQSTIATTQDAGRTWTDVGPAGIGFMTLRFANADDGWALDVYQNIWSTHDGGATWQQLPGVATLKP